jgi:hypothetical protein
MRAGGHQPTYLTAHCTQYTFRRNLRRRGYRNNEEAHLSVGNGRIIPYFSCLSSIFMTTAIHRPPVSLMAPLSTGRRCVGGPFVSLSATWTRSKRNLAFLDDQTFRPELLQPRNRVVHLNNALMFCSDLTENTPHLRHKYQLSNVEGNKRC